MKKPRISHIGMRTIKTSLAVMICLSLGLLFKHPNPLYSCIAAILTIRETIDDSIKYSITRILATVVGGIAGMLFLALNITSLTPWIQIPLVGAAVILTIHITIIVKRPDITALTVVTLLVIILAHPEDKYVYAIMRIVETIIGIVVAVGINAIPNFRHKDIKEKS